MDLMRMAVHIDRLLLKGFRQDDRHALVVGLRQELGRLLAERNFVAKLTAMGNVPRLQVDGVHIEHGARPQRIGERLACGIRTGFNQ
jgi:hypothetical protein